MTTAGGVGVTSCISGSPVDIMLVEAGGGINSPVLEVQVLGGCGTGGSIGKTLVEQDQSMELLNTGGGGGGADGPSNGWLWWLWYSNNKV